MSELEKPFVGATSDCLLPDVEPLLPRDDWLPDKDRKQPPFWFVIHYFAPRPTLRIDSNQVPAGSQSWSQSERFFRVGHDW